MKFIIKNSQMKLIFIVFISLYKVRFHHPPKFLKSEQIDEFYALKCLYSGVGRCGQVSNFSNVIFKLGYDTE